MPNSGDNFKFLGNFYSNWGLHRSNRTLKTFLKFKAIIPIYSGEPMNHRLLDALDLLKMLEVVFEQRQALELNGENHSKSSSSAFPWSGVRLTLRQSRELLEALQEAPKASNQRPTQSISTSENVAFEQAVQSHHIQRSRASREAVSGDNGDKNYRGTFNRIQLTQEPKAVSSEEQAAPAAR
jgi:hypothetical protein